MTKHYDTDFQVVDTRTCRERQDASLSTLETCIENLERRVAALEATAAEAERAHQFLDECYISGDGTEPLVERIGRAVYAAGYRRISVVGAVNWNTGAVTWADCYQPPFVHSPGYPAQEEAL